MYSKMFAKINTVFWVEIQFLKLFLVSHFVMPASHLALASHFYIELASTHSQTSEAGLLKSEASPFRPHKFGSVLQSADLQN